MSAYDLNAISGIKAMSQGLGVISNNLANAQTMGFKASRAEFADMFTGAQKSPGNGVRVGAITQNFQSGTIAPTGRDMDLAINGDGFFVLNDQTGKYGNVYTRNGSFKMDKDGFITDQIGNKVMGYTLNADLSTENKSVFNTTLSGINLMDLNKTPRATDEMHYEINLDGQEDFNLDPFDVGLTATVGSSKNLMHLTKPEAVGVGPFGGAADYTTQKMIYDTLGGAHRLTSNFYKRDVVEVVEGLSSYQSTYNSFNNAGINLDNKIKDLAEKMDANNSQYGWTGATLGGPLTGLTPTQFIAAINDVTNWDSQDDMDAVLAQLDPVRDEFVNSFNALQDKIAADVAEGKVAQSAPANALFTASAGIVLDNANNDHLQTGDAYNYLETDFLSSASANHPKSLHELKVAERQETDVNPVGEKYTSWIVQFTVEDYDVEQGKWVTSGHRYDHDNNVSTGEAGILYELRFDTNGQLIDAREPVDRTNPQGISLDANKETQAIGLDDSSWVQITGKKAKLDWLIDAPLTGAYDPIGSEDPARLEFAIDVDFSEMTMFAGDYILHGVTQNGYAIGDLVGIATGKDGVIEARYSNGRSIPVAELAIANFSDLNALEKLGGQMYAESYGSGAATIGKAQAGGMGTIEAGALEYSNVDVADELVNMIQTQRTYQASAQVISTSQVLMQTILNL